MRETTQEGCRLSFGARAPPPSGDTGSGPGQGKGLPEGASVCRRRTHRGELRGGGGGGRGLDDAAAGGAVCTHRTRGQSESIGGRSSRARRDERPRARPSSRTGAMRRRRARGRPVLSRPDSAPRAGGRGGRASSCARPKQRPVSERGVRRISAGPILATRPGARRRCAPCGGDGSRRGLRQGCSHPRRSAWFAGSPMAGAHTQRPPCPCSAIRGGQIARSPATLDRPPPFAVCASACRTEGERSCTPLRRVALHPAAPLLRPPPRVAGRTARRLPTRDICRRSAAVGGSSTAGTAPSRVADRIRQHSPPS